MTRQKTNSNTLVDPSKSSKVNELIRIMREEIEIPHVYYEPPPGTKMRYPCVRFRRNQFAPTWASNRVYHLDESFQLTLIYSDPDSEFPAKIAQLPMCRHDRHYTSDNLSHDVYIIYV